MIVVLFGKTINHNGWWYGLVKADHYHQIEDKNLIQPLLTIPLVTNSAVLKTKNYVWKY